MLYDFLVAYKMTRTNIADAFRIQYDMITASGIWPKENPDTVYKIKAIISWVLSMGLCLTMGMEVINDITDFTKLSEILYIQVTIIATVVKQASFTYQGKHFLKIVNFLKDPVFVSYPDHLDHYMATTVKYSTLIANFYRYLVGCCIVMFIVYPIMDNKPLPFPFPYDFGQYRYLMYVFQIAGIGCCAWNNSCFDTLTTSLMGIGAAQLDILCEKIMGIKHETIGGGNCVHDHETDKIVVKKLEQCIEHHTAIIRLIESVEGVFTLGLLAQFMTSIMVICNTLFHIVLISSINSQFFMLINYFIIIMVQLFMYCWYGNEIIWKSVQLGEACYTFNWYNSGNEVRKYLFIIMERAKRPLKITTLKFSTLSLTALTSILQWSYSCLALLLKMYQKQSKMQ